MSTDGYDSAKDSFDSAKDAAKETFNDAANSAQNSANEFKQNFNQTVNSQDNKKILAGLLGIFLGGFGIHKFILGYNTEGIILAVVTILGILTSCILIGAFFVWIPGTIGLIEGIIYLTKSDEEFYHTYQLNKKAWF
ncbi:TM2 domain-containing membrane protein YozV [Nonlabens dokdonensis]|jgi:TM2 domain-containing membrane protein YozV|uniref:TM2 domain containing protein n=2 Tax=Nonlabens dokdonensis TaxID=328515 RepID=L7W5J9_NONDD|nr:TM2 domain-containing protein [Nonlabens dokdonensis]AGC76930.1 TM2 domain containing protein [Nonlabens dokdonensis DSW-6]PZX36836.1 TM2 domain-containing membrane protein YozV [Nonlabens dokdonensis]